MHYLPFFNFFHPISNADYALLENCLKEKSFAKNEYILQAGQTQKHLYFVTSGIQMSYFENGDKQHVIAFTYSPSLCAIPDSFMLQRPATYNLKCLTDSTFNYITYDDLQQLFNQSQPIERLFRKMTEVVLAGLITRHIELHALSMEERFKTFAQRSPHLLQQVPHKHIASYLNIDATNFSKLFNSVKI